VRKAAPWVALLSLTWLLAVGNTTSGAATLHSKSKATEARCFKENRKTSRSRTMPTPERLVRTKSFEMNGTITFAPPPASDTSIINPRTLWHEKRTPMAFGKYQLFLAYYSDTVPATQGPNGVLVPFNNHVLSWILYGRDEPFDTAGISYLPSKTQPPPPTCTFSGWSIVAWNAVTGTSVVNQGFVPSFPSRLAVKLKPWH
jgi:hypothetical protein